MVQHLHEVRAADQSAGVPEKDKQERPPTQIFQPQPATFQIGQVERARGLADARRAHVTTGERARRRGRFRESWANPPHRTA
jgi:hypothetical protein